MSTQTNEYLLSQGSRSSFIVQFKSAFTDLLFSCKSLPTTSHLAIPIPSARLFSDSNWKKGHSWQYSANQKGCSKEITSEVGKVVDAFADLNQIQSRKVCNVKIKAGHFNTSIVSALMAAAKWKTTRSIGRCQNIFKSKHFKNKY